jgi:hypothetical protein
MARVFALRVESDSVIPNPQMNAFFGLPQAQFHPAGACVFDRVVQGLHGDAVQRFLGWERKAGLLVTVSVHRDIVTGP